MYFFRSTSPSTILSICGCSRGSPPGIETIGAPHSSAARKHSSGRELPPQDFGGMLNLAAAGAGQIAPEQGLEHQDQRIALIAAERLAQHVPRTVHICETGTPIPAVSRLVDSRFKLAIRAAAAARGSLTQGGSSNFETECQRQRADGDLVVGS